MGVARYYGTVFRVAFTHSLSIAQSVIFALAILIGGLAYFVPKMQAILTPWVSALNGWQVATGILGSIVFARLVLAFYWTFDEEKRRADRAEQKIKGSLKFEREIRKEGDGGHYLAYATVRNTSIAAKLHNCYCEIVQLQNDAGQEMAARKPARDEVVRPDKGAANAREGREIRL